MKRICTIFLAVTLLLGTLTCLPLSVSAETEGEWEYFVRNGEAVITDYTGEGGEVVIPSTLGGYPVTIIGKRAFHCCYDLTSVVIPEGVTEIWDEAFYYCTSLKSAVIPDGVTTLGYYAFRRCVLTSIAIPDSVTTIGRAAFSSDGVESITVAEGNLNYYSSGNCLIEKETGVLLYGCMNSVIPDGVTAIEWSAFQECYGLKSIVIPDSVTTIGSAAFAYCFGLESVVIPDSVTTIEAEIFFGCSSLTSVVIPESVVDMGESVFDQCESLTDIYCLAPEKPEGWHDDWLGKCDAKVHWGYKAPEFTLGDLGGNGRIDSNDYMLLKRYCLGSFNLTEEQLAVADINKDGRVNSVDYMLLKRVVLGTYEIV